MRTPTWVLGYHGCDREVGEAVLSGKATLRASGNAWDWLGTGIYFWENSAARAMEWARSAKAHPELIEPPVKVPFVVGAVIDLGNCLDLSEAEAIRVVEETHEDLRQLFALARSPLPANTGARPDRVVRRFDCAVINYGHEIREQQLQPSFDSVRAVFVEGKPLYEGAGFYSHTHIQIALIATDRAQRGVPGCLENRALKWDSHCHLSASGSAGMSGVRRYAYLRKQGL